MPEHHLKARRGAGHAVTPESAGWSHLHFSVHEIPRGRKVEIGTGSNEMAFVPVSGSLHAAAGGQDHELTRTTVFEQMPHVLYVPPGETVILETEDGAAVAAGGAAAEGRYPTRLFSPKEMRTELRGGGTAKRQVNHILSHPLPAERLILYEVYVPRGTWAGWPPHCHDGYEGSPYLEEIYYFRLEPADGWALHRNYRVDSDFDETFAVSDGDVVLVTQGFHSSAAAPGSHMWFLNYLAGDPRDEERAIPPFFQPEYRWIEGNWDEAKMDLPAVVPEASM
jgi:5-deoxy-glucuronate isomerase